MAMNFDVNQIRSVMRGEVNGSVRFLLLAFCAAAVWIGSYWLSGMSRSALSTQDLQQKRYNDLTVEAERYKLLSAGGSSADSGNADAMMAFTQVSAQIELGARVTRLVPSSDGRRCSVEVSRLYAEELTAMVRGLAARGMIVISAEIRALPAGDERLFSLTAVIGPSA